MLFSGIWTTADINTLAGNRVLTYCLWSEGYMSLFPSGLSTSETASPSSTSLDWREKAAWFTGEWQWQSAGSLFFNWEDISERFISLLLGKLNIPLIFKVLTTESLFLIWNRTTSDPNTSQMTLIFVRICLELKTLNHIFNFNHNKSSLTKLHALIVNFIIFHFLWYQTTRIWHLTTARGEKMLVSLLSSLKMRISETSCVPSVWRACPAAWPWWWPTSWRWRPAAGWRRWRRWGRPGRVRGPTWASCGSWRSLETQSWQKWVTLGGGGGGQRLQVIPAQGHSKVTLRLNCWFSRTIIRCVSNISDNTIQVIYLRE